MRITTLREKKRIFRAFHQPGRLIYEIAHASPTVELQRAKMKYRRKMDAQQLWLDTVEFARTSILRMNGSATDEEVNAVARKIYSSMEFLVKAKPPSPSRGPRP